MNTDMNTQQKTMDVATQRKQQELVREAIDAQIPIAKASKVMVVPVGAKAVPPPVPPKPKGLVARAKHKVQKRIAEFKQPKPSAPPKADVMKPSVYSQLKKKLGGSAENDEAQRFRKQIIDTMAAQRDTNVQMFQMLSKQIHQNGIEAQQEAMKTGEKMAEVRHKIEAAEVGRMAAQEELYGQINKGFSDVTEDVAQFKKQVQFAFNQQNLALCGLVKCMKDVQDALRDVHKRCRLLDNDGHRRGAGWPYNSGIKRINARRRQTMFGRTPQIKDVELENKKQDVKIE